MFGTGCTITATVSPRKKKQRQTVREVISYQTIKVTCNNDPCRNSTSSFEHVLSCGHLISTALPDEPCAPNCHHIKNGKGDLSGSLSDIPVKSTVNRSKVSDLDFYCDACIETENEALIPADLDSTRAEARREVLRKSRAEKSGKVKNFRKCYIAWKTTAVPCYSDGALSKHYVPRRKHHRFDVALPQSGDNMFEDANPDPPIESQEVGRGDRNAAEEVGIVTKKTEASGPELTRTQRHERRNAATQRTYVHGQIETTPDVDILEVTGSKRKRSQCAEEEADTDNDDMGSNYEFPVTRRARSAQEGAQSVEGNDKNQVEDIDHEYELRSRKPLNRKPRKKVKKVEASPAAKTMPGAKRHAAG